jgi:hypothetical protein
MQCLKSTVIVVSKMFLFQYTFLWSKRNVNEASSSISGEFKLGIICHQWLTHGVT